MKHYVKFNPVRTLAALAVLGNAIIALVAKLNAWEADFVLLVNGVATAVITLFGTLFVEGNTASTAALDALAAAERDSGADTE